MEEQGIHIPVLLKESLEALRIRADGTYADCTAGKGGGHTLKIEEHLTTGLMIALDRDPEAAESLKKLTADRPKIRVFNENFANIGDLWKREDLPPADGVLMDLGLSSHQLAKPEKGFSFQSDGPLVMKYDPREPGPDASEIVNTWTEEELRTLFYKFDEKFGKRIARRIVERRKSSPIETTAALSKIVASAVPARTRLNPGTLVFLALRSTVNKENEAISAAIADSIKLLRSGGRLAIITYQSTEDRLVKWMFRKAARGCTCELPVDECQCSGKPEVTIITKKPVAPMQEEIDMNPRARSAKLRVIEKL